MNNLGRVLTILGASIITIILGLGGLLFMTISTDAGPSPLTTSLTPPILLALIGLMWWALLKPQPDPTQLRRNVSATALLVLLFIFGFFYFIGVPSWLLTIVGQGD